MTKHFVEHAIVLGPKYCCGIFKMPLYQNLDIYVAVGVVRKTFAVHIFLLSLQVENACYTLKIRGSEVPKHMLAHKIETGDKMVGGSESETTYDWL